jgi:hypothetical protein
MEQSGQTKATAGRRAGNRRFSFHMDLHDLQRAVGMKPYFWSPQVENPGWERPEVDEFGVIREKGT